MNAGVRRSHAQETMRANGFRSKNGARFAPATVLTKKVRVWIATENRLLSDTLTHILRKRANLEVSTIELTGADNLSEADNAVLLLGTRGNLANDLESIQHMRAHAPNMRILLLGMGSNEHDFLQCVRAGVSGYLLQDASRDEVLHAIEAVAAGDAVCRGSLCSVLFRYFEREACGLPSAAVRRKLGFSRREQQLIPLIAQGLTNKEIANHFSLSEQTIKNHVYRMKHKVGAEDRLDIVQIYRVQGFLV